MVKLLYFAGLRESLGTGGEQWSPVASVATVGALRAHLAARGGVWAEQFAPQRNLRAAVNQDMRGPEHPVADGDEVAFFPPVTGG